MTNPIGDPGHGHSPAAWSNVVLMMIGIAIAAVGWYFMITWVLILAAVVFIAGPIMGFVLMKAGYGANGPKYQPKGH